MVIAGIARKLDQPVLMNADSVVVDHPANALGLPCEYELTHPNQFWKRKIISFRTCMQLQRQRVEVLTTCFAKWWHNWPVVG
jgi:hypothetical protein